MKKIYRHAQTYSEESAPLDGDTPKQHGGGYLLLSCVFSVSEVNGVLRGHSEAKVIKNLPVKPDDKKKKQ